MTTALPAGVPAKLGPLARRLAVKLDIATPKEDGRYLSTPTLSFVIDLVSAYQRGLIYFTPSREQPQVMQYPVGYPGWKGASIIDLPKPTQRAGSTGQPWGHPASF